MMKNIQCFCKTEVLKSFLVITSFFWILLEILIFPLGANPTEAVLSFDNFHTSLSTSFVCSSLHSVLVNSSQQDTEHIMEGEEKS